MGETERPLTKLKQVQCYATILRSLNIMNQQFEMAKDAYQLIIEVVLKQGGHPTNY